MIATDGAPSRGRVDDQYRQVSEPLQGKACQVRAIAIPMPRRIDIRTGVAAQVEVGDVELGLVLIALARGVVIHHHVDRRLGQAGIGLHTGDDLVAQLDKARHRQFVTSVVGPIGASCGSSTATPAPSRTAATNSRSGSAPTTAARRLMTVCGTPRTRN